MEHHVCKGTCGAISEQPGTCSAEGCSHQGRPFESCGCGDKSVHIRGTDDGLSERMPDEVDTTDEGSR